MWTTARETASWFIGRVTSRGRLGSVRKAAETAVRQCVRRRPRCPAAVLVFLRRDGPAASAHWCAAGACGSATRSEWGGGGEGGGQRVRAGWPAGSRDPLDGIITLTGRYLLSRWQPSDPVVVLITVACGMETRPEWRVTQTGDVIPLTPFPPCLRHRPAGRRPYRNLRVTVNDSTRQEGPTLSASGSWGRTRRYLHEVLCPSLVAD